MNSQALYCMVTPVDCFPTHGTFLSLQGLFIHEIVLFLFEFYNLQARDTRGQHTRTQQVSNVTIWPAETQQVSNAISAETQQVSNGFGLLAVLLYMLAVICVGCRPGPSYVFCVQQLLREWPMSYYQTLPLPFACCGAEVL